jgi:hypothetical protein
MNTIYDILNGSLKVSHTTQTLSYSNNYNIAFNLLEFITLFYFHRLITKFLYKTPCGISSFLLLSNEISYKISVETDAGLQSFDNIVHYSEHYHWIILEPLSYIKPIVYIHPVLICIIKENILQFLYAKC